MDKVEDTLELYRLVRDVFGYKARMRYYNPDTKEVACILYDSFLLKCNIDDRYSRFGAGIAIGGSDMLITEFLGDSCSLNNDPESITSSLLMIDQYCRLRLPDKFLEVFDRAHGQTLDA